MDQVSEVLLQPPMADVAVRATRNRVGGRWTRRHYGRTPVLIHPQRVARLLSRLGAAMAVAVIVGWFLVLVAISANELLLVRGGPTPWMAKSR